MKLAPFATGACALALLVSSPSLASIPGNIEQKADEGLLHVCRDVEPANPGYIVCDEQVDPSNSQSPYTGSECEAVGLDPVCRIDFVPQPRLRGVLGLIGDSLPLDGDGNFGGTPQSGLTIQLTYDWKTLTLIELFDGTKIGNWNEFDESALPGPDVFEFTNALRNAFQFSNGNLTELGLEIRDLAQQYYPGIDLSNTVPVLVDVVRDWNRLPVDGTGSGLASAGYFRVQVRFARVRP